MTAPSPVRRFPPGMSEHGVCEILVEVNEQGPVDEHSFPPARLGIP